MVYRPTKEDPLAWTATIQCELNVKKLPDMNYKACKEALHSDDVVIVGFAGKLDYVLP